MKLISSSPDDTENIGFKLGGILKAGDVVGLHGPLGSGKTTMVKGIAGVFGINRRDITSASFTIIAEYPCNPPFYHIDLYRLEKTEDIENAGIWDCIRDDSVSVIEWAEKIEDILPENSIKVYLKDEGGDQREILIKGINEKDWNNL